MKLTCMAFSPAKRPGLTSVTVVEAGEVQVYPADKLVAGVKPS